MTSRISETAARLAVVGGGPRAIGVLERLAAHASSSEASQQLAQRPLRIELIDPHMPGSGRIWRADESSLLLMNSRATDVTIFTDDSVECEGPVVAGPSLARWAEGVRTGAVEAPTAGTERLREIAEVEPHSFVSRRVQALYLEWFFGQVLAALPSTIEVTVHRSTVTSLQPLGEDGPWRVHLEDRGPLEADLLLLAAGHTDARPDPERHELAAFARRHGGAYVAPAQASDADLDALAPAQQVIVRGMGLAFIDLMALLTEGRGGRFVPDPLPGSPGRLRYDPSGREPRLMVGSGRGVPYHSKVNDEGVPTGPRDLVHVTEENLRSREDGTGRLDFRADVLPLIAAEIARAVPDAPRPEEGEGPLDWLDHPLSWLDGEAEPRVTRDAVVRHIEHDLRSRTVGDVSSARALFQVLLRITGALVDLLPATRLRHADRGDYPRGWHSLFSFVDSGPPPHRLQQLLALERAGIVGFIGPRLEVEADDESGRFVARGGGGVRVTADALIDAFLTEQTLVDSANPLLRGLVHGSAGADALGRGSANAPGKLETDADHRVVAPDGTAHRTIWAVGPWTSELPIGAFARPRTNAPCFRRNDRLARDLLRAVVQGPGPDHAPTPVLEPATASGRGPLPGPEPATAALAGGAPSRGGGRPSAFPARTLVPRLPRLGVLGPGKLGTAVARTALRGGLEVAVAGRGASPGLRSRIPGATVVEAAELAEVSDVVVLTVPLHVALALDPEPFRRTVVIDATNAWGAEDQQAMATARAELELAQAVEGRGGASLPAFPDGRHGVPGDLSASELLAARMGGATVVKTLNHIGYHDMEDQGRPAGGGDRRAIAVATDDDRAAAMVHTVLHRLGFDAVGIGPLAEGRHLEPGGSLFAGWSTRQELEGRRLGHVRAA